MIIEPNWRFRLDLQEELKLAQVLINHAKNAAFCLEENAEFIYVNNATCSLFGYSHSEMLSMTLQQVNVNWEQEKW
ncbi:MAG: PAS domain S-box protein, partial [Rivularia sp. (in: cyanobacteria)]